MSELILAFQAGNSVWQKQQKKPPVPATCSTIRTAAKPAARVAARLRGEDSYTAADIEVLEGLEPVRRRPGMYIGGTDEKALHHLFAEVMDNAMDEAVEGHASWIEVDYGKDGFSPSPTMAAASRSIRIPSSRTSPPSK